MLHYNAALVVSDCLQARMGNRRRIRSGSKSGAPSMARGTRRRRLWSWRCVGCSSGSGSSICAPFHRLRRRPGLGRAAQDHPGLPSVPRGECGGGGNRARQRHDRDRQQVSRGRGHLLVRASTRRQAGRPSRGRGLSHAGQRQDFLHALLRRARGAASGDAEPDANVTGSSLFPVAGVLLGIGCQRPAFLHSDSSFKGSPRPPQGPPALAKVAAPASAIAAVPVIRSGLAQLAWVILQPLKITRNRFGWSDPCAHYLCFGSTLDSLPVRNPSDAAPIRECSVAKTSWPPSTGHR